MTFIDVFSVSVLLALTTLLWFIVRLNLRDWRRRRHITKAERVAEDAETDRELWIW